jgi:hypothetical protein
MMKKFIAVLVVLAIAGFSSMALAADVSVGGSVQLRSRDFSTLNFDKLNPTDQKDTQTRVIMDINAKSEGASAKISLWNDFNSWGGNSGGRENNVGVGFGNSGTDGGAFGFREAWIMFNVPGIPVTIKGGHQLLQLGQGFFFRSQHFGSDAWVAFNDTGANHFGLVDVKAYEGATGANDDVDAYVIVDTYKISDTAKVGVDFTMLNDRRGVALPGPAGKNEAKLQNLSFNFTGKAGPVNLAAQLDYQMGKSKSATTDMKYKGNEILIKGNVPVDPVTINFMLGRGSGAKIGQTDVNQFVNLLDVDPHYTFLYEYKIATAAGAKNTGLSNTTVISVGAGFAASKSVNIGLDIFMLQSTEKVSDKKAVAANPASTETTSEIGTEVDITIGWKISDNLAWNWNLGYLKPGKGLAATTDAATGIMGVLAYKF